MSKAEMFSALLGFNSHERKQDLNQEVREGLHGVPVRKGSMRGPRRRAAGVWEPWGGHLVGGFGRQVRSLSLSAGVDRGHISWKVTEVGNVGHGGFPVQLEQRTPVPPSAGGWTSQNWAWQDQFLWRPLSWACGWRVLPMCVCVPMFSSYKDTSSVGSGLLWAPHLPS